MEITKFLYLNRKQLMDGAASIVADDDHDYPFSVAAVSGSYVRSLSKLLEPAGIGVCLRRELNDPEFPKSATYVAKRIEVEKASSTGQGTEYYILKDKYKK